MYIRGITYCDDGNCSSHGTPLYTSQQCAYAEGFAEYYAAIIRGSSSVELGKFEAGTDLLTNPNDSISDPNDPNGSRIEGAVAALLVDLTDGANETHDAIDYPEAYIGDLIRTCSVTLSSVNLHADGIDHFIRCLEKQVDSSISSYFWPRTTTPTAYAESATEPGSWSLSNIRTLWKKNLYNE